MSEQQENQAGKRRYKFGCLQVLGILLIGVLLTALATGWWIKHNIYASPFAPTELSKKEQTVLEDKLNRLNQAAVSSTQSGLKPEAYSEQDAKREIGITEKELNALIAKNPKWADRIAIDLANDLISLTLLIPIDPDFPLIGGTTARITAGTTLRYENGQMVVIIRGVSIGGIPLPSAWMGDLKNKDLMQEFGGKGGFWDQFSKGVDHIELREGRLFLKLKE